MTTTNHSVSNDASAQNKGKLPFISIYFLGINAIVGSDAFLLPQEI